MAPDLAIAPRPAAADSAAAQAPKAARPGRESTGRGPAQPAEGSHPAAQPQSPTGAADSRDAARIKQLLTDPSVAISTRHDDETGRLVLHVQSRATGELVEQIPSDHLLRLYASIRESLVDETA